MAIKPKINKIKSKLGSIYKITKSKIKTGDEDIEIYLKKVDKKLKKVIDEIVWKTRTPRK